MRSFSRRHGKSKASVQLDCISAHGQTRLQDSDLPLVFVIRNERHLLPSFLRHYRNLGVTRFICTDDRSTDGTTDYLLAQDDVDVWTSPVRYKEARRGRAWRERLFDLYGHDRWYVNVDSDEYLIYEDHGVTPLRNAIQALEGCRHTRMAAPMLDMYPLDLNEAKVEDLAHLDPWDIASHFDADGYELRVKKRALSIRGGPRRREFNEDLELIKYPLIYWDGDCQLGTSIHQPVPYARNFVPPMGVLLHFKFFSDVEEKTRQAIQGGQYYNNSCAYRAVMDRLGANGGLRLGTVSSTEFTGVDQLLELGFFARLPKPEKSVQFVSGPKLWPSRAPLPST